MFDKNNFKNVFRSWAENNPNATKSEAIAFCQDLIPASAITQNYWLIEQSISWFSWVQEQKSKEREQDLYSDAPLERENYI